jgi:NAD(P)-dependent dehydrogenase (short-subunit alcohol dehydrogenase family)
MGRVSVVHKVVHHELVVRVDLEVRPGPFKTKMMAHVYNDPALHQALGKRVPLHRSGEPDDACSFLAPTSFQTGPEATATSGSVTCHAALKRN